MFVTQRYLLKCLKKKNRMDTITQKYSGGTECVTYNNETLASPPPPLKNDCIIPSERPTTISKKHKFRSSCIIFFLRISMM